MRALFTLSCLVPNDGLNSCDSMFRTVSSTDGWVEPFDYTQERVRDTECCSGLGPIERWASSEPNRFYDAIFFVVFVCHPLA